MTYFELPSQSYIDFIQVNVASALLALVEYCCAQPVFPSAHPLTMAPVSSDLMTLAEATQQPPLAAVDQHAVGAAVIEQVSTSLV